MSSFRVIIPIWRPAIPEIRTYSYTAGSLARWVHLDIQSQGFHAMVTCRVREIVYIGPLHQQSGGPYLVYTVRLSAGQ